MYIREESFNKTMHNAKQGNKPSNEILADINSKLRQVDRELNNGVYGRQKLLRQKEQLQTMKELVMESKSTLDLIDAVETARKTEKKR